MLKKFVYFSLLLMGLIPIYSHADPQLEMNGRYADIVIEPNSGNILHATNANSIRHPASLTKMMTLYLAFKALKEGRLKMDQRLPVSDKAAAQSPTKLGLKPGQTIAVKDAIMSMVTLSANDAAVVLAEGLAGNEVDFGRDMTVQAAQLGMKQTHFSNASGLPDPAQTTTAYDMAILGTALYRQFPEYYSFFSLKTFNYAGIHYHNHNHLMEKYPGMDGIKTGYIGSSGFNLVASATQKGVRLIGVIFGGTSPATRDQRMEQLLNEAFSKLSYSSSSPININISQNKSGHTPVLLPY